MILQIHQLLYTLRYRVIYDTESLIRTRVPPGSRIAGRYLTSSVIYRRIQ